MPRGDTADVGHRFPSRTLGLIAVGGAAGTLLRVVVSRALPSASGGFPWDTLTVNLAGSLLLGFVVVTAVQVGPARYLRPLVGTGFCGGLTTFSTFAVEVDLLVRAGRPGTAAVYSMVSLGAGLALAKAGMVLARALWGAR
jgi:CrcB protein